MDTCIVLQALTLQFTNKEMKLSLTVTEALCRILLAKHSLPYFAPEGVESILPQQQYDLRTGM